MAININTIDTITTLNNTNPTISTDTLEKLNTINILGQTINMGDSHYTFFWSVIINISFALILAWLAYIFTKKILLRIVTRFIRKTKTDWDDILLEKRFFRKAAWFAPAIVLYYYFNYLAHWRFSPLIQTGLMVYMLVLTMILVNAMLDAVNDIYNSFKVSKDRPIKSFIQIVKTFLFFIIAIIIIGKLIGESPLAIITGLGAFAAILMLVFKDTILGFVAGIHISANNMLRIGDWISMPSHGADGEVMEISLTIVKVRNWDKTIVTIPTYKMVNESYTNWRGMEESGGRRIKRHVNIDVKSIRFLNEDDINKFSKDRLIGKYIKEKSKEIKEDNNSGSFPVNQTRLTNIGTFRIYLEEFIKQHPLIHDNMTFMVRQLQPTDRGLPIELYGFSKVQSWVEYENIQSDLFDHIMAIIPEFDLKIFQFPTGEEFKMIR